MRFLPSLLRPLARALFCVCAMLAGAVAQAGAPDCHGIRDLVFVAHLDDDLLFMNPDVNANIEAGGCVRVVYLTASDAGEGEAYMLGRERGVRQAYAFMARQPDIWDEGIGLVQERRITRFVLRGNPRVELWHMRLKDPWLGPGWGSLTPLSRAESEGVQDVDTLGSQRETYTRDGLVRALAGLIQQYHPSTVRHLDDTISVPYTQLCWRCAGHGHPDHIASARLVREAMRQAPGNYAEMGYIDYPSQERASNLDEAEMAGKSLVFQHYAWNDYHYCAGPSGCREPAGPAAAWVQRAYYVSRQDIAPQLYADGRGGLVVFATGETNGAANHWDLNQHRWQSLGGRTGEPLVSFAYADGTAGLMARDPLGGLWANKQRHDGSWQGWQALAGTRVLQTPVVAPLGEAAAVALGYDGRLHWVAPTGIDGSWGPWQALPGLARAAGTPAVARGADSRYVVFASTRAGEIFYTRQLPGQAGWQAWRRIPAPSAAGGLAAIRNPRQQVELYFRQRGNNHLTRLLESGDTADLDMSWGEPEDLGLPYVGQAAIDADAQGWPMLAVLERPGGALWLVEQGKAARLPVEAASPPAMLRVDDSLYLVARSPGRVQRYQVLSRTRGQWNAPLTLDDLPAGGGGPFAALAARPQDVPRLGSGAGEPARVVRPSASQPGSLTLERLPAQTTRPAAP
ncbi:lipoprotein [Bordetella trematum]|uniref:PIG-L family deacetylase n=1 Tax=Bordetella trematum TaxID=123899 RepID=UPI000792905C|nr:PIG-L family deacetylase [Bordetella trematum]CZZ98339.1 lipoprotein [Bordetella trematum]